MTGFFPFPFDDKSAGSLRTMMETWLGPWAAFHPWLALLPASERTDPPDEAPMEGPLAPFLALAPWMMGPVLGPWMADTVRMTEAVAGQMIEALGAADGQPVSVAYKDTHGPWAIFVGVKITPRATLTAETTPWLAPEGLTIDWTP
ncbi:hypothetical protein [Pararhodospirillum photometricum]|nr:hypothetical protein [Pararhodospirillum photometricum]